MILLVFINSATGVWKMKRIISCLLVCVLLLSCAACSDDSQSEIILDQTELELQVGGSHVFKVKQGENQISSDDFEWKSSDESIVMAISEKVVALKAGTVVVTATSDEIILSCVIVVSDPSEKTTTTTLQTVLTQATGVGTIKTTFKTKQNVTTTIESGCNHQYSNEVIAPTCIAQGYTKHTCKKCKHNYIDNYIETDTVKHLYNNYKCKNCGEIDKTHTYEYFVNWILANGTKDGDNVMIIRENPNKNDERQVNSYGILYDTKSEKVYLFQEFISDFNDKDSLLDTYNYFRIEISGLSKTYPYEYAEKDGTVYHKACSGTIECNTFTDETILSCADWKTFYNNITKDMIIESANRYCVSVIRSANSLLQGEYDIAPDSGLTIADLGFTSFLDSIEE